MKKRILIVTDAASPQVNGVVRTVMTTTDNIARRGIYEVLQITPEHFKTFKLPSWAKVEQEITFAYHVKEQLWEQIQEFDPDYIHIATEGPLGLSARSYCLENNLCFTTAYHTMYPEYVKAKYHIPLSIGYAYVRWFHKPSSVVMVATPSLSDQLQDRGFTNRFRLWSRGVDTVLFNPDKHYDVPGPYALYVGRISHEKNIEAFLKSYFPLLQKVVVGDGLLKTELQKKYPKVHFVGTKQGEELAKYYASAEVFVFPSKTDTFGLVMIEALACGTPVVAYDVPSPCEVITNQVGVLSKQEDLSDAIKTAAQDIDRNACRTLVEQRYTWDVATNQFLSNLVPV